MTSKQALKTSKKDRPKSSGKSIELKIRLEMRPTALMNVYSLYTQICAVSAIFRHLICRSICLVVGAVMC